jgi:GT2 family glycosyltransferase
MAREPVAPNAHVAVVILTWNGREDTLECLESLTATRWERLTTIVVDNGSTDGTPGAVRQRFPGAVVIELGENMGFAAGNNVGIDEAIDRGADYLFVLNNDTLVDESAISELVAEAERSPEAGALSPLMYYDEPDNLVWYAGAMFDPRRGYNRRHIGYCERDEGQFSSVREITHACGAAMLIPRAVVERIGPFDPQLFFQVEDVEWSLRAQAAGYRILFVPGARVWHKVASDTGGEYAPATAYYWTRNTLEVCRRYAPMSGLAARRREATTLVAGIVHARRAERPLESVRGTLEGWRDFHRRQMGRREDGPGDGGGPPARPARALQ